MAQSWERFNRAIDRLRPRVLNYETSTKFVRLFDGSFYFGTELIPDLTFPFRRKAAARRYSQPNPNHRVLIEKNWWGHCCRKIVKGPDGRDRVVSYACAESQAAAAAKRPARRDWGTWQPTPEVKPNGKAANGGDPAKPVNGNGAPKVPSVVLDVAPRPPKVN